MVTDAIMGVSFFNDTDPTKFNRFDLAFFNMFRITAGAYESTFDRCVFLPRRGAPRRGKEVQGRPMGGRVGGCAAAYSAAARGPQSVRLQPFEGAA